MERIYRQSKAKELIAAAAALAFFGVFGTVGAFAQGAAPASGPKRVLGQVQSISPTQLVVKTDSGQETNVAIDPATTMFVRVPPGKTDLKEAEKIDATAVMTGDRVLAQWRASADMATAPAARIVVMSKSAIDEKRTAERADWQRRGIAATVTAVNPTNKELTVKLRGLGQAKIMIIDASGDVQYRRYAEDSVKFADAKPSSLDQIKVGDQVRVLGNHNEDNTAIKAEQIVSGTFRNFPGTVVAVDAAGNTVRVKNLETKKEVSVKIEPDSMVRRMPQMMAQRLAMLTRVGEAGAAGGWQGRPGGAPGASGPGAGPGGPGGGWQGRGAGSDPGAGGQRPHGDGPGGWQGGPGGAGMRDPQQMLERMPAMPVTELKPGDAIIVASTVGTDPSRATAIALIAGVEPLLTAPRGQDPGMGSWNLNIDINP